MESHNPHNGNHENEGDEEHIQPNQTIYINNLNERIKKEGNSVILMGHL